jgi:hypothetical protein
LAALLGAGTFLLNLATRPDPRHRPEIGAAIEARVEQAHPGDHLALSDIATFDWDRIVILPPYASNQMAAGLGVAGWDVEKSPTFTSESGNLVGFVQGETLVAWTVVGRRADLPPAQTGSPLALSRHDAVFIWSGSKLDVVASP